MVAGPASGDFAEYRLEARDIRQAGSQIDDGRQCIDRCAQTGTDRTAAPGRRQKLSDSRSLG